VPVGAGRGACAGPAERGGGSVDAALAIPERPRIWRLCPGVRLWCVDTLPLIGGAVRSGQDTPSPPEFRDLRLSTPAAWTGGRYGECPVTAASGRSPRSADVCFRAWTQMRRVRRRSSTGREGAWRLRGWRRRCLQVVSDVSHKCQLTLKTSANGESPETGSRTGNGSGAVSGPGSVPGLSRAGIAVGGACRRPRAGRPRPLARPSRGAAARDAGWVPGPSRGRGRNRARRRGPSSEAA